MASETDNLKSTNKILIVVLIIAAFFLGSLTNKVATLEKGTTSPAATTAQQTQPGAAAPAITNDDIKTWAKDLGLNSGNFNKCLDEEKFKDAISKDQADATPAGVSGTPAFFVNGHLLVGAQPFSIFKDVIDFLLEGGDFNNPSEKITYLVDGNNNNGEIGKDKISVTNGGLPALGKENAKVTIVEFADLECPYCRKFFLDAFPQIKKEYIDTGKVVTYFRHYPLPFHPLALPFANAVECANEQGKFWEMHDKIYAEQGA